METHTGVTWRLSHGRGSRYVVLGSLMFNIEEPRTGTPTVFLTWCDSPEEAHAYALSLTAMDTQAGLVQRRIDAPRAAQVSVNLEDLAATYIGGATPLGDDLAAVIAVLSNGEMVA